VKTDEMPGSHPGTPGISPGTSGSDPGIVDPIRELLGDIGTGRDGQNFKIHVIRKFPKTLHGKHIGGYLGEYDPGIGIEDLKAAYGGGRFWVQVKDASSGKLAGQTTVEIAGDPLPINPLSSAEDYDDLEPEYEPRGMSFSIDDMSKLFDIFRGMSPNQPQQDAPSSLENQLGLLNSVMEVAEKMRPPDPPNNAVAAVLTAVMDKIPSSFFSDLGAFLRSKTQATPSKSFHSPTARPNVPGITPPSKSTKVGEAKGEAVSSAESLEDVAAWLASGIMQGAQKKLSPVDFSKKIRDGYPDIHELIVTTDEETILEFMFSNVSPELKQELETPEAAEFIYDTLAEVKGGQAVLQDSQGSNGSAVQPTSYPGVDRRRKD